MKRIVNGVTYNTDTSTRIAQATWENETDQSTTGILYQTRGGAFFIHHEVTKQVWIEREDRTGERVEHVFEPMSPDGAQKWMMEGEVEVFHNPFGDPPEAAAENETNATIYIRVPSSLKSRVDQAAQAAKTSGNVWAMRCVERCLEPASPEAEKELSEAFNLLLHLRAYGSEGLSDQQIKALSEAALERLREVWTAGGYDSPTDRSDLDTRIMGACDLEYSGVIDRQFRPYAES